jgi:hypothetical protein
MIRKAHYPSLRREVMQIKTAIEEASQAICQDLEASHQQPDEHNKATNKKTDEAVKALGDILKAR